MWQIRGMLLDQMVPSFQYLPPSAALDKLDAIQPRWLKTKNCIHGLPSSVECHLEQHLAIHGSAT